MSDEAFEREHSESALRFNASGCPAGRIPSTRYVVDVTVVGTTHAVTITEAPSGVTTSSQGSLRVTIGADGSVRYLVEVCFHELKRSRHWDPLRQDEDQLPRAASSRVHLSMAQLATAGAS
jgi:hypothetical protein